MLNLNRSVVIMSLVGFVFIVPFTAVVDGWVMIVPQHLQQQQQSSLLSSSSIRRPLLIHTILNSKSDTIDDEVASFAATLEDDDVTTNGRSKGSSSSSYTSNSNNSNNNKKWKDDLDKLIFDRTATIAQRQIIISDLLNANEEIRDSVTTAIRERKIDPLLTPKGKKLQDGTRAVAYQIQTDILPSLTSAATIAASSRTNNNINNNSGINKKNKNDNNNGFFPPSPPISIPIPNLSLLLPNPEDVTKFSNRLISTVTNQIQKNIETFQMDIQQDPRRIPERIKKQAEDILTEASNVFAETPIGLQEPPYTVIMKVNDEFEIRDYPAYTVATTQMSTTMNMDDNDDDEDSYDLPNTVPLSSMKITSSVTEQGVAFNTLASYIFGSNSENRVMEMTTPVTTTMSGEMRFYIPTDETMQQPPEPLQQDTATNNIYETNPSKIRIETIPAARLAVRRFTGFCTNGEIIRQKNALLNAISNTNNIELDVPHGQTVGHVIFQYNPPYTIPVLRRNEIAVPVTIVSSSFSDSNDE